MTDNEYFSGNEQLNAYNAQFAPSVPQTYISGRTPVYGPDGQLSYSTTYGLMPSAPSAGVSVGGYNLGGASNGAGAYTDKDIFELQSALNQAAQVQTAALNAIQQRTDKTVSGNIDYFKELSKLTDSYLSPYRALAQQGAGFYLDAVGANGAARQQAVLPSATNIFNQQGINATPFLQSIPGWSLNNAQYGASQIMNGMFGQAAPNVQNQQQFLPTQQSTQSASNLPSQQNPFGGGQISSADQRAQQIAALQQQIKDNEAARLANQQTMQTKYDNGIKAADLQRQIDAQKSYLAKPYNGTPEGRAAAEAKIQQLQSQIDAIAGNAYSANELQANKQYFDNVGKVNSSADASYLSTGTDLNNKLSALQNYQEPIQAPQAALGLNQQVPQAQANQQLVDFTNRFKNTSVGSLTNEANAAVNSTMGADLTRSNKFLDLMQGELTRDKSQDTNKFLNTLIDPATGAVNNWLNSDLVKQVMGETIQSGTNAVQNAQAARGMLDSGQTLSELQKVGVNAAGQYIVPFAGQLANNVLSSGVNMENNRLSNYYNLLGQGAQYAYGTQSQRNAQVNNLVNTGAGLAGQGLNFANNMMQTQANLTAGLQNNYGNYANSTLQNLMNNSNQSANQQSALQVGGLANLLSTGQNAVNTTANMYANLGSNVANQNVYGNDVYANAEMSKAAIEASRLQQMAQLNNMMRRADAQSQDQWGNIGGLALSLGAMALGV